MQWFNQNLPYLISGIATGGQYALIAIGYTMVYGILRLINFAHGDIFMAAGLMMVYAAAAMPIWLAIPLVLIFTVLLGALVERVAYKPLRSAPRMSVMISAIGVSYLLQNVALYVTGHHKGCQPGDACSYDYPGLCPDMADQPYQGGHGHAGGGKGL